MSIADIERKKTEIWADHIHRCHDAELSEAEKWILQELDWEIKRCGCEKEAQWQTKYGKRR